DVTRDLEKGRVYIPLEAMDAHGYAMHDLERRRYTKNFREMMRDLVNRTHLLFLEGLPLVEKVDRRLAVDLELFSRGGLAILEKIRAQDYNVLERRPALGKKDRLALLAGAIWRVGLGRPAPRVEAADAWH